MAEKFYMVEKRVSGGAMSHFVTVKDAADTPIIPNIKWPSLNRENENISLDAANVAVLKR